jgi:hypothetical protein
MDLDLQIPPKVTNQIESLIPQGSSWYISDIALNGLNDVQVKEHESSNDNMHIIIGTCELVESGIINFQEQRNQSKRKEAERQPKRMSWRLAKK